MFYVAVWLLYELQNYVLLHNNSSFVLAGTLTLFLVLYFLPRGWRRDQAKLEDTGSC